MKIHLAYENVDTILDLIPTHRPKKRYLVSLDGKKATYQRYIIYEKEKNDDILLEKKNIFNQLKSSDIDVDIDLAGKYIKHLSRITVDQNYNPVFNYVSYDVLLKPDGTKEERPHIQTIGNVNNRIPVTITEHSREPQELLLDYVFRKSYYITHKDGVSYKFLFDIAKKLHDTGKFAEVEAFNPETKKREALILVDGGRKFPRAYVEGIVKGDKYALILHLTDQELIAPERSGKNEGD